MDNVPERLSNCLTSVFPRLTPEQISAASATNVEEWDSIAQVTLLTVIGEEFNVDIDFEEFEGATSFEALLAKVRQLGASA
jgi:acyl carrier protein